MPVPGEPVVSPGRRHSRYCAFRPRIWQRSNGSTCRRRGSRRRRSASERQPLAMVRKWKAVTPAFSCDAGAMRGAGMSSLELPETNVEAAAGLYNPTMPGVLIYEYTPQVTHVVEYGVSADAVFSGRAPPPAEGARFDLYLEGPVKGPKRNGTLRGVEYLWAQLSHIRVSHIPPSFTASSLTTSSAVRCNSDGASHRRDDGGALALGRASRPDRRDWRVQPGPRADVPRP